MEKIFNVREGLGKKDDTLPPRFLNEPLQDGASKGHTVPLEIMLEQYYYVRGWDEKGIPKSELLEKLNIRLNF